MSYPLVNTKLAAALVERSRHRGRLSQPLRRRAHDRAESDDAGRRRLAAPSPRERSSRPGPAFASGRVFPRSWPAVTLCAASGALVALVGSHAVAGRARGEQPVALPCGGRDPHSCGRRSQSNCSNSPGECESSPYGSIATHGLLLYARCVEPGCVRWRIPSETVAARLRGGRARVPEVNESH